MFYSCQRTDLSHYFTRFIIRHLIVFLFFLSISFCFQPLGAHFLVPSIEICSLSKMLFANLSILIAIIAHLLFILITNRFVFTQLEPASHVFWPHMGYFPILRPTANMKTTSHQQWETTMSRVPQPNYLTSSPCESEQTPPPGLDVASERSRTESDSSVLLLPSLDFKYRILNNMAAIPLMADLYTRYF